MGMVFLDRNLRSNSNMEHGDGKSTRSWGYIGATILLLVLFFFLCLR